MKPRLGYLIDSCEFKISLPPEKLLILSDLAKNLLAPHQCSLCEAARFIGLAISFFRVVLPAKLHFRSLERFKIACLKQNNNNFDAKVYLPPDVVLDLKWWAHNAHEHNGVPFQKPVNMLSVTTDASRSGWGAICDGRCTASQWSSLESTFSINTLEVLAIFFCCSSIIKVQVQADY